MLKIETNNGKITEADIEGSVVEVLADLSLVVNAIVFEIAETPEDKVEILDEFTRLLKKAWQILD